MSADTKSKPELERLHLAELPVTFIGGGYCGKDCRVVPCETIQLPGIGVPGRMHVYMRTDAVVCTPPREQRLVYVHKAIRDGAA